MAWEWVTTMEPIFENENVLSRAQLLEYYRFICKKETRKAAAIQGLGVAVLAGLTVLNYFDPLFVILTAWLVSLLIKTLHRPENEANKVYDQRIAYYDDVMSVTRVQFGEQIVAETKDGVRRIEYRKIENVLSLEHSYIICDKLPGVTFLSRNGFTKGTFEEFKQFLREKRPDLNIPE